MKPELEQGISNLTETSFKAFRLQKRAFLSHWHYHPELELVFFLQGSGMRFIGDDIALYKEGDLFLIGKNLPHTFVTYEEAETPMVEALCIQFAGNLFETFAECAPLQALFQEANRGISFLSISKQIVDRLQAVVSATGIQALITLLELLELLSKTPNQELILPHAYQRHAVLSDADTRIRTAIDFIGAHYHRSISLQEIADVCHFSPNAFCRWFRQHLGLTFIDYLNKVRLTQVCQLLISTDYAIGHIALQTGFENISTLNRLFQQKLGTTPSSYRNKHVSRVLLPGNKPLNGL